MSAVFFILGALPYALGYMQNQFMLNNADTLLPYRLISIFFLLLWGLIAFLLNSSGRRTKEIVIFMNLLAAVDLLLVGIQELYLHAYWPDFVGLWSQLFYLPVINLSFRLTTWSSGVFVAYALSFVLMAAASFFGCKLREKIMR